jgi:hypothetical protein
MAAPANARRDRVMKTVGVAWLVGYAGLVVAKHTVFSDSWGSPDLSVHWHYWAWQAAWTGFALCVLAIVDRATRS